MRINPFSDVIISAAFADGASHVVAKATARQAYFIHSVPIV